MKIQTFGQITVAFLSIRIQKTESKLFSAAGMRVEFGGLTDVETGGVSGLEDKLVCSFKLVADVVWDGISCYPHSIPPDPFPGMLVC